tara:strand:- start:2324 stop:2764 length:441 start_codon:yes stop_codon:yes gene_type:complete
MTDIYINADRLTLDGATGGVAAGTAFPLSGTLSTQGLTTGSTDGTNGAIPRGVLTGVRCALLANTGSGGDTVKISIYRSSQTSQTAADRGELVWAADFTFAGISQTLMSMVPDQEIPFFEQMFVTATSAARANTVVTVTPLLKAIA